MRKIKNKFLLVFLVIGLVPLTLMGVIALISVTRTHRVDISSLELQLLRQKKEEIQKLIDDTVGIFQLQIGYKQTIGINIKDQPFLLNALLEANKNLKEASFIDLDGKETLKIFRDYEGNEAVTLNNVSKLKKFTVAASGQDYLGEVYYTEKGPMITLASPVKNKDGIIIMVMTGELYLGSLQNIAKTAHLGNKGYFYIADGKGKLLANSLPDRLKLQADFSNFPFVASVLQGHLHTGLEDEDRFQSIWNEDVIGAGMKLEKTGWGLIVEWPADDAFSVIRMINRQLYAVIAGAFFIILLLTFWVSSKIARPIQILTEGATIIGTGHFDHRIQIKTQDELQGLGESFNTMAKDLATIQQLREQAIRAEALEKSLEKERELSRSKDAFIKNSSHQLRTPLATISWGLESAVPEVEKLAPDLGKSLRAAYEGIQNLNEILNDLLSVSEYGLGYCEAKPEPVDLAPVLQEVLESYESIFKKKNITSSYRTVGSAGKALGNAVTIKKALTYIVDNASIYANTKLEVLLREEGNEIIAEFKDDGIGIPEEDKSLIFTQFFRAKNSIVKKNVGTGLGLFIVSNIVKGLGGRVWFDSKENSGSTFYIALLKSTAG